MNHWALGNQTLRIQTEAKLQLSFLFNIFLQILVLPSVSRGGKASLLGWILHKRTQKGQPPREAGAEKGLAWTGRLYGGLERKLVLSSQESLLVIWDAPRHRQGGADISSSMTVRSIETALFRLVSCCLQKVMCVALWRVLTVGGTTKTNWGCESHKATTVVHWMMSSVYHWLNCLPQMTFTGKVSAQTIYLTLSLTKHCWLNKNENLFSRLLV